MLIVICIFFVSNWIAITLPIFIAMTVIVRVFILQGNDIDMTFLQYEAGAILILKLAILVRRFKTISRYTD